MTDKVNIKGNSSLSGPAPGSRLPTADQPLKQASTIHSTLQKFWNFSSFRPLQQSIIESIMGGKDTLALMPTGGGKSLCYQVPGMTMEGMCLVISPLIALMKDQVEGLRKKNITAYAIYAGMTRREVMNILTIASESNCKFLYVSPERLESRLFQEYLPGLPISMIAVDEAHCISQWGYDFRPPYLRIAALRAELPGIPVLALTASATPEVQQDICDRLTPTDIQKPDWQIFRQSFERPNLSYSVFETTSRINRIVEILTKVPGTGIVYCRSRKRTREISEQLHAKGISADFYHAGLAQEERGRKQMDWIENRTRVIVCTNAFGMGIDKPDVRIVVHADVPDCIENYYQEAGRAGRDRNKAYAVLLFDEIELEELKKMPDIRYPAPEDIKAVYQAVSNYLQVPAGGGRGEYFEFDFSDFSRKFKLDSMLTLHALKALEQEGWLVLNEQVFQSSRVQFNTTKDYLYTFENENPALDPLIKTLLRTYEGIFDQDVFISELFVAQLLRAPLEQIHQQLNQLHDADVIRYTPRTEKPQLYFTRERVRLEELRVNSIEYQKRKEKYSNRIADMIAYVWEQNACRSRITASYFGDNDTKACGVCDNCLRRKNTALDTNAFETIHERIKNVITANDVTAAQLIEKLSGIPKEKAWKVIETLLDEGKLIITEDNVLRLT